MVLLLETRLGMSSMPKPLYLQHGRTAINLYQVN
jgi:hypothetical protein